MMDNSVHSCGRFVRRGLISLGLVPIACVASVGTAVPVHIDPDRVPTSWRDCLRLDTESQTHYIDAACFLEHVMDRYRSLAVYEDVADVMQETSHEGDATRRVHQRYESRIDENGTPEVEGRAIGSTRSVRHVAPNLLKSTLRRTPILRRYSLWIAPHLQLAQPEVSESDAAAADLKTLSASSAEAVSEEGGDLVRLEVETQTANDDGRTGRIEFFVNPDSMLVERVRRTEPLPGGGELREEIEIRPTRVLDRPGARGIDDATDVPDEGHRVDEVDEADTVATPVPDSGATTDGDADANDDTAGGPDFKPVPSRRLGRPMVSQP